MASIKERKRKDGSITYLFEVRYIDPKDGKAKFVSKTWAPDPFLSYKEIEFEKKKRCLEFEREIKKSVKETKTLDLYEHKITIKKLSEMWMTKINSEKSQNYIHKANFTLKKIIEDIGNVAINDITPDFLQDYYNEIDKRKKIIKKVFIKNNWRTILSKYNLSYTKIKNTKKISMCSFSHGVNGKAISERWANKFVKLTKIPFKEFFEEKTIKEDYKNATNLQYKKTIRLLLGYAKKLRYIEENYATSDYIEFPKSPRTKIDVMDDSEIKIFFDTVNKCEDIRIKTAMMIFLLTGFRRGEVSALSWNDVDFNKKTLSVSSALIRVTGQGVIEKDPKTITSLRTISIPDMLCDQLEKYYKWQQENKYTSIINGKARLFFDSNGKLMNPETFTLWMNKILNEAKLKHHSLHSLRHTNVALQIAAGVPIVTVSQRAGHARTSTTSDIYAYVLQDSDKSAANLINNIFESDNKNELLRSNNSDIDDYRKAKEDMQRLGFKTMEEYMDYLDYINIKKMRSNRTEKKYI